MATGDSGDFTGLAGVSLFTSAERFEVMRDFYVEQVGLTPDPSKAPTREAFTWGTPPTRVRLILSTHDEVSGPSTEPNRVMVNLLTPNLEAVARGMAERGVVFTHGPMSMPWGGMMATFRDPDGNTMQLLQPA